MQIAVCDDKAEELRKLETMLAGYPGPPLSVRCFQSGPELVNAVRSGMRFDAVFLDILMPGASGMDAAKELRQYDDRAEIVFLTVSPDFALESYSVRARHYIVKPVLPKTLFGLLDDIRGGLEREQAAMLVVKTKSGLRRLRIDQIEYCEIILRSIHYHMANGAVYEESGNMDELESRLLHLEQFIKPHRSYIVNMDYITHVNGSRCVIELESMKEIPLPKIRRGEIRDTVHNYLSGKGGETR